VVTKAIAILAVLALAASGCGSSVPSASSPQSTTSPRPTAASTTGDLQSGVRDALEENFRLSDYVLWHNAMPAWAKNSTQGAALAEMRASANAWRKKGTRLRSLKRRLTILAVKLDPSYRSATAHVRATGRIQPYRAGEPHGASYGVDETARMSLRRVPGTDRFVVVRVWSGK
jgi:hypothetical protein